MKVSVVLMVLGDPVKGIETHWCRGKHLEKQVLPCPFYRPADRGDPKLTCPKSHRKT